MNVSLTEAPALAARQRGAASHSQVRCGGRAQPPLPAPVRRWSALYGCAAMVAFTAAVVLALVGVANTGNSAAPAPAGPAELEFVRTGESLWTVAARAVPGRAVAETVWRIIELNGLHNAVVYAGQALLVPAQR